MVELQEGETKDPNAALKAEAKALMTQRDALEQELAVATARLEASGAGLQGRLVDSEVLSGMHCWQEACQHGSCAATWKLGCSVRQDTGCCPAILVHQRCDAR